MNNVSTIRIIQPSSRGGEQLKSTRFQELQKEGFNIQYSELTNSSHWPYAAKIETRVEAFISAMTEENSQIILCGRGGYGASDLLPFLPWDDFSKLPHKWIVGFSDISAILSAFWTKLKWPGIHGPMPFSSLWGQNNQDDISFLLTLLKENQKGGRISIDPLNSKQDSHPLEGWLFGGCLSVLCNLVGTPYFPNNLDGAVLFLEEVGENPGRILRYWNQLLQSGLLKNVRAVIWGHLKDLESELSPTEVKAELAHRSHIPSWSSDDFGHLSPNWSLGIGANCLIHPNENYLSWRF